MQLLYRVFRYRYNIYFLLLFPCYSSVFCMLLYPLCKLPDGPLYTNVWLLYFQEPTKSAVMLWQEDTHILMRLTSARFNPKKVHFSPNGGIVSFLDDGILWLRRISRRYTRALETAFPVGTIVDYTWYDMNHIIVCTRKGTGSSIYCVNLDGTVCGELSFTDATIVSVSCASTGSLLCVVRDHTTSIDERIVQVEIDNDVHPIKLQDTRSVWSTNESVLFCQHITPTTAYVVTTAFTSSLQESKSENVVHGSLYYIEYAEEVPVIHFITKIPLEGIMRLDSQGRLVQKYQEGIQSVMPTISPDGTTLAIPLVTRCGTGNKGEVESRLMLFDSVHNTSYICACQKGIAFLSPQWTNEGFFCGGTAVEQEHRLHEDKRGSCVCTMYYDEDAHKLLLPHIMYSGIREKG